MPGARPAPAAGGVRPRGCGRYGARVPAAWCGCWLRCFDRRGPVACGCCISLLPAVSAVSALFIAAAVSSHRRKGPVFSPHLGRTRGVRPPFLPGGIVCPAPKKETRCVARLFFVVAHRLCCQLSVVLNLMLKLSPVPPSTTSSMSTQDFNPCALSYIFVMGRHL